MSRKIDAKNYHPSPADPLFFDTNIWLYIAGPLSQNSEYRSKVYSRILRDAIANNTKIFYNQLVISEYINRCLRIYHSVYKETSGDHNLDYKEYRHTSDYEIAMRNVSIGLKFIYATSTELIVKDWSYFLNGIADYMEKNPSDYNDLIIAEAAKNNQILLVSHDRDMAHLDCSIVTANRRILQ